MCLITASRNGTAQAELLKAAHSKTMAVEQWPYVIQAAILNPPLRLV